MNRPRFIIIAIFLTAILLVADWPGPWGSEEGGGRVVEDSTNWKLTQTGANADRGGSQDWLSPGNILACDGGGSELEIEYIGYTDWLRATNFGFNSIDLPEDATILGIEVKIRQRDESEGVGYVRDSAIYLRKTSGQVGDNGKLLAYWTASWRYKTRGGPEDDWNAELIPTDIVSEDFGVDISVSTNSEEELTFGVDCVQIRIFYSVIL